MKPLKEIHLKVYQTVLRLQSQSGGKIPTVREVAQEVHMAHSSIPPIFARLVDHGYLEYVGERNKRSVRVTGGTWTPPGANARKVEIALVPFGEALERRAFLGGHSRADKEAVAGATRLVKQIVRIDDSELSPSAKRLAESMRLDGSYFMKNVEDQDV
jgi:hypothetical protein